MKWVLLKEVHSLRRFQMLVHPGNRVELRLEVKEGIPKEKAFEEAKENLEAYLATQNVRDVSVCMSQDSPRQHPESGKFKLIIHVQ